MAKKKYRYRSTKHNKSRKFGWLIDTDKRLSDYKTIGGAVRHILRDDRNFKKIVNAIEEQNPGFFTDVEFNENLVGIKTDKKKAEEFIIGRIEASKEVNFRRTHKELSNVELIKKEFNSEAYLSKEDRIMTNLNTMFSKRESYFNEDKQRKSSRYMFNKERQLFKDKLGTTDMSKIDLQYFDQLPYNMPRSPRSTNKGYYTYDKDGNLFVFEMIKEKIDNNNTIDYKTNIIIHYIQDGQWKQLYNPKTNFNEA